MYPLYHLLPAAVRPFVASVICYEDKSATGGATSFPFFADGLPGIMFSQSNHPLYLNRGGKKISNLFLYGQTVKPIQIDVYGNYRIIVFCLTPAGVKELFGIDACELTDDCVDFEFLHGARGLADCLFNEGCLQKQVQLIAGFLERKICRDALRREAGMYFATHSIIQSGGKLPLKVIQAALNISERTLERKFMQQVGISPKLFMRIARFKTALSHMQLATHSLTEIAHGNGYTDQAHFIKDFRAFTSQSPRQFIKNTVSSQ